MAKLFFFDLETTGLDSKKNGIHQIAGEIEIHGHTALNFNIKMQPHPGKEIEDSALAVSGLTKTDLEGRTPSREAFKQVMAMLNKYASKWDKKDKLFLVGYNNASFDNQFLRQWFLDNGEKYFGSYFWANSIDVMVLATQYTIGQRGDLPNFQLGTVAPYILGKEISREGLHDADYDGLLTKAIYKHITEGKQPTQSEPKYDMTID